MAFYLNLIFNETNRKPRTKRKGQRKGRVYLLISSCNPNPCIISCIVLLEREEGHVIKMFISLILINIIWVGNALVNGILR